jgi:hypothetical protein
MGILTSSTWVAGCGLLATAPFLSFAQAPAEAPGSRYYVGIAAYTSTYQPIGGSAYRGTRVPFQVVAGYQFRPRLAVQLGVAYSSASYSSFGIGRYMPTAGSAGVYYDYSQQSTVRNASVALLARYTLTRQPTHRLQADLLGGITLETNHYAFHNTNTDSSQVPIASHYDESGSNRAVLLTAGTSVRYRFGPHLEALLDVTLNYDPKLAGRLNRSEVTDATALGLRYRFGKLR